MPRQARNEFEQTPLHLAAMLAANASAVRPTLYLLLLY
jgi:hypothetical protein